MKTIKTKISLILICCLISCVREISTQQTKTMKLLSSKRRTKSLAYLVEAADAVITDGADADKSSPQQELDALPAEHATARQQRMVITPIAETPVLETRTETTQTPSVPLVAQTVTLNDGEDDDYDDLSEEIKEVTQTGPIQEVVEQVVNEGPGFAIEEKTVIASPAGSPELDVVEFQLEDADLQNLVKQVGEIYNITFIPDDVITPLPQNGKAVAGNKISFRTEKPLSKKQAWQLFQTFLDVAGLALVPQADHSTFRIVRIDAARKAAIPVFIGVKAETLPDSDQIVRYLYFVQNLSVKTLEPMINELRSPASAFIPLQEMNAFVLTDKAYNIKSLMNIINELDRVALPQSMSVLKLRRANAADVKSFYDTLTKADDKNAATRLFPARKQPTSLYFPDNVRIIAEPRTNSLILLGSQDAIAKIETFISTYVDTDIGKPYSPLRTYTLKYADANTIASIMTELTQFGKDTAAGKAGGIRDGDKYMKNMTFTPELATNRLIIRGDEEDYMKAREIIEILDEPQPQVAIDVLVIAITLGDTRSLGTQLRSAQPGVNGLLGDNVKFQTSGSKMSSVLGSGIVTNDDSTGVNRLLGNLISLATGAFAGNTLVTLGADKFGIWGIFNVLQTITNAQIVANPFLVATNKQPAKVSIGELRRVVSGTVSGATGNIDSFTNDEAVLSVDITPQINSDGMIVLDLLINVNSFANQLDLSSATQNKKSIKTTTIVADREVLALGGLVKNTINQSTSKVPLLANIPIFGWLFKNKLKTQTKDNLLILISSRIIKPERSTHMTDFTQKRVDDYIADRDLIKKPYEQLDPVQRFFFNEKKNSSEDAIDNFLFDRSNKVLVENKADRNKKRKKKKINKKIDTGGMRATDEPVVPNLLEAIEQKQVPAPIQTTAPSAQPGRVR
ncbi:hypothetical protein JST99_00480 [Candidatus Dependentiae bacterium]|nr:hypothetical protein [Candidatus Dependentiae bacterium]